MANPLPDHVRGLWYIAAAIAYPIAVLLAERRYGLTGAVIALVVCLVVQLAIIEPAERRRRRARANFALVGNALASIPETQGGRFACPCCGHLTLTDEPPGTYLICDVCFWEDDQVQFRDPDYEGGANAVSLNQARQNFQAYGASELHFKSIVRDPLPEEQP